MAVHTVACASQSVLAIMRDGQNKDVRGDGTLSQPHMYALSSRDLSLRNANTHPCKHTPDNVSSSGHEITTW